MEWLGSNDLAKLGKAMKKGMGKKHTTKKPAASTKKKPAAKRNKTKNKHAEVEQEPEHQGHAEEEHAGATTINVVGEKESETGDSPPGHAAADRSDGLGICCIAI